MCQETELLFNDHRNEHILGIKLRPILLAVILFHHVFAIYEVVETSQLDTSKMLPEARLLISVHTKFSFRFLTTWNFGGQIIYLLIELALIYSPLTKKLSKRISHWNWIIFMGIVWPTNFFIMSLFWLLFNYDRELIFPKLCDVILTWHVNHSMHTMIIVLIFVEFFLTPRDYLPNFSLLSKLNYGYMAAYCVAMNYTFLWDGVWIYPFLYLMTWPQRFALYIFSFAICQIFVKFGYFMMGMRCKYVAAKSVEKID